jgi:tRNA(Leu) C34 or U34 (ribose-2'-O)-methylase TrmL
MPSSDLAIPEPEDYKCPCGRKSRVVKEIAGRVQDFLLLDDNSKVIGPGLIFKNLYNVKRVQIFQDKAGSADFYIVKGNDFTNRDELILKKKITQMLGLRFKFRIIYVSNLKTSKRGKKILVLGSEATGISPDIKNRCSKTSRIPINPDVDSLNVAAACAIITAEAWRQRKVEPL